VEPVAQDWRPARRPCPVDLLDRAVREAPYDAYRLLRETAPVCRADFGPWIISCHSDAQWLLESGVCERWGQNRDSRRTASAIEIALGDSLRLLGPEGSEAVRRVVGDTLGSRHLDGLEAGLGEAADQSIRGARSTACFDVIAGFAEPLAFRGVQQIIGVTGAAGDRIQAAATALGDNFFSSLMLPDVAPVADAPSSLADELAGLVRDARGDHSVLDGGVTLARRLVAAAPELVDAEIVNLLLLIIFASYHNMVAFIGNAVLALAAQPDAAAALIGQPVPVVAIMELLRFDPPLQFLAVTATLPIRLADQSIAAGEAIFVAIGAANRDPAVFHEPDRLDFTRDTRAQLSFGAGAWRCLGARLAQSIARIALDRLLAATGVPRLAATPVWRLDGPLVQRGMKTLLIEAGDD
jgi:cytochrome P450